jgi:Fe2+ transport system protein B
MLCFYIAIGPSGFQELGTRFPTLALDAGVALLGIAAYSGIFVFLGTAFRRPVLIGLIFVFGWQAAATYIPGFIRKLTVAHYLQALLPHESLQGALSGLWGERPSALAAVSALVLISLTTHALAIVAFSRKEFAGRVSS